MTQPLRHLFVTGTVWLTAASTLFASLPHIECRCPNGNLKLICLLSLVAPSCCDQECCEAAPAPEAVCCCKHAAPAKRASAPIADGAAQVKRNGCSRQLVQPGLSVLTYTEAASTTHHDVVMAVLPIPSVTEAPVAAPAASFASLSSHSPAPPDLVIVLQHFLI